MLIHLALSTQPITKPDTTSDITPVLSGVPQGSVLNLLLHLILVTSTHCHALYISDKACMYHYYMLMTFYKSRQQLSSLFAFEVNQSADRLVGQLVGQSISQCQ